MTPPAPRPRLFAGDRLRALRARLSLSQTALSRRLGISTSYLSQIESGDRPITGGVLAALARNFPLDWVDVAPADDSAATVGAIAAGTDPSVPAALLDEDAVLRGLRQQPLVTRRMTALHAALRRSQEQLRVLDDRIDASQPTLLPWEEVRDWFQGSGNYIDPLDRFAEALADTLTGSLAERLRAVHGVGVIDDGISAPLRAFDAARATLTIDGAQPVETRRFQLAHQLIRLEADVLIEGIVADAPLRSDAARELLRVGLANYGAGALLLPYGRFRSAARACRHDVDALRQRFGVSFEQVCHRLSTLQRPGLPGVPFFFCRIDMAGNITKRHSATRLQFAQYGGACPLWVAHEAVAISDRILVQVAEMPDGVRYVSMAKGLVKATSSYRRAPRRYAVVLGCEVGHAGDFVYGDGLDVGGVDSATPIGPSCRICPRRDCDQRAFPPAGRELRIDPDRRTIVPYAFE
ncbi:short-chain fatty acyl-CoA regulator family protein [Sphingomonas sp. A2-49]|uniref:helix-turn-helix domain-containing protein n=1 Tax=Sphingomonas sp. A2-49 TaxID=1391375 RepID=UPI0021D2752E|nr:helix-turn-helix transcriptional regulator [Sphingomonas sp. A2-49]MCU6454478.1 short-chain fatty acyl-CoA regulator family protein [Sphingomonas sp. A2-49]